MCFTVELSRKLNKKFLVSMRLGETPVPIPNTMVKTYAAEGTALETMWEIRWLPEFFNRRSEKGVTRQGL